MHYIFVLLHLEPCIWTHEWFKHVSGHYAIKLHSKNQSAIFGLFNKIYTVTFY